jgi:hypothetical protein
MATNYLLSNNDPPVNSSGGALDLQWAVKTFEAANMADLETTINLWLLTDPVTTEVPRWLGPITFFGQAGNNVRALVQYAYYVP